MIRPGAPPIPDSRGESQKIPLKADAGPSPEALPPEASLDDADDAADVPHGVNVSVPGLYIHIPFCEQHCHYCTFPVVVVPESEHAGYVDRLRAELAMVSLAGPLETVYLGGGTPSLLAPELIGRVLGNVNRDAGEITLEANPGTLVEDGVKAFVAHGVNRVSLGAQSFHRTDLEAAGRLHSPDDTRRDVALLRRNGLDNISIDLIAGLPHQGTRAWTENLDAAIALDPDHVSIYMLEIEDSAVWAKRRDREGAASLRFPDDDLLATFAIEADDRLTDAGYHHYEISSWARPGRDCRHNVGYWNGSDYRGIGMGAHSLVGDVRFWNTRSFSAYREAVEKGRLPVAGSENRTPRIRLEEAMLVGLRRLDGFDVRSVATELSIEYPPEWFERVERLEEAGIVRFDDPVLQLTRRGWLLASGVAEELLCPDLLSILEATR